MSYEDVWGAPEETTGGKKPGVYLGQVALAEYKTTEDGKPYWNLRFSTPGSEDTLVYDKLFLAGKPNALTLTKKRLIALGFKEGAKPEAQDFRGRRVFISLVMGKKRDDGKQFLEVDVWNKEAIGGYWPETAPPVGKATANEADLDSPF